MSATDDIKARIDLVTYIQSHVPSLKKSGRHFKACCPFHNEKTPSFVVNPQTQRWHCYGACAEGGDLFTFYEKLNHVDFKEALKALAQDAGVELPQFKPKENPKQNQQLQLLNDLSLIYHKILLTTDDAQFVRDYLDSRNIHIESIEQWQLGYAPKQNIIPKLINKGYTPEDLLELGIAYESDKGDLRSRFYNRLMIPIHDPAGQVVGFGARQLDPGQQAKYVNSRDSDIFTKSNLLYGWHIARTESKWNDKLIVVEGYMDVIQAHQAGYKNVVAQMGTALTDAQVKLMAKNGVKTLILCLDGDDAGQQATERAIDNLIAHADVQSIRIIELLDAQDPDSIIRDGFWDESIESAIPVIDYLIESEVATLPSNPSLADRHAIANKLIPKLYKLDEDVGKLFSVQRLATELGLNGMALMSSAQQLMSTKSQKNLSIVPHPNDKPKLHPDAEKHPIEAYVVFCLIKHPGWYWNLMGELNTLDIAVLNRTDFVAFGDAFQQIIDCVEGYENLLPADVINLDVETLSDNEASQDYILSNAIRIRLNHIQRTLDELVEVGTLEQCNNAARERRLLTEKLSSIY